MHFNALLRSIPVWIAVLAISGAAVFLQSERGDEPAGAAPPSTPVEFAAVDLQDELLGKVVVAGASTPLGSRLRGQIAPLSEGNLSQRLAHAVLLGEIGSREEAVEAARAEVPTEEERAARGTELRDALVAMLEARAAGGDAAAAVDADRRALVESKLGYFARVVEGAGAEEADRTLRVLVGIFLWYALMFVAGSASLIALAVLLGTGRMKAALVPAAEPRTVGILGETFVVWFVGFLLLTVGVQVVTGGGASEETRLALGALAMFLSLGALAYPVLRGVPFSEVRRHIGLDAGAGVVREVVAGLHCYVSAVPLLAVGLAIFAILSAISTAVFGKQPEPSHPAVEMIGGSTALRAALLYLLASVAAPIVEEIAFRGLFYGHLRGVVAPQARLFSALFAALFSSFVFAVIHPQGVLFVPALGGLAIGFCLFREWRGSLIAPMVAHGVNNAVTMTIGLLLLS